MENRDGLVVDGALTQATGAAGRDTAIAMWDNVEPAPDHAGCRQALRHQRLCRRASRPRATPHVAQKDSNPRSATDGRTTRHSGYTVSQRIRKRIVQNFGWGKDIGPVRKTEFRGKRKIGFQMMLTLNGYNRVRMRNILAEVPT